jgi:WD40 repeat protein
LFRLALRHPTGLSRGLIPPTTLRFCSFEALAKLVSVNAVCFADESSTNILVSGSDDGYVKVWDRRSLSSSTPSGILVGATEGITYTSPKGDGRYVVVNFERPGGEVVRLAQDEELERV